MSQTATADPPAFPGIFRPELFFMGETRGAGIVVSPFGRARRCSIETRGWDDDASDAMHFDEVYHSEDGTEDRMCWALRAGGDGGLSAKEVSVVGEPRSILTGSSWRVRFRRLGGGTVGTPAYYDARYHLVAPDTVMKTVTISLFGVPVATLNGFHRRVGG